LEIEKCVNVRIEHCLATIFVRFGRFSLLLTLAGFVLMSAQSAHAATITVPCSVPALITAIINANSDPGPNTLELAPDCTCGLTASDNTGALGANGLPQITGEMTINGHGTVIERSAPTLFRLLQVNTSGNLTLNNLTIRNGIASAVGGGGIANFGVLNVVDSTFTNNLGGCGGAIYTKADGSLANHLTVTNSIFFNNTADG
jgi:hypothetical protein